MHIDRRGHGAVRQAALAVLPDVQLCGNAARTDLCGGRGVTPVPTTTVFYMNPCQSFCTLAVWRSRSRYS